MTRSAEGKLLLSLDACGCGGETPEAGGSCAAKLVLSYEEEAVLRQMRQLQQEAKKVRLALAELGPGQNPPQVTLSQRLKELRARFHKLQEELAQANLEKLRRLGHEP